jgi:hypothetical protein
VNRRLRARRPLNGHRGESPPGISQPHANLPLPQNQGQSVPRRPLQNGRRHRLLNVLSLLNA